MRVGKRILRQPVRQAEGNQSPLERITIDRTELSRAESTLKSSMMTAEDWAKYGPYVPPQGKFKRKGGDVA